MKTYIDGLKKALELLSNNPCDADGYHYCSQQDTYKNLIEAEIKVSRVELPVILRATELKLYRPYYGCCYEDDYNGENVLFTNESDAWNYIYERCCPDCRSIDGGRGSQCEAEWSVFEYDSCESK